MYSGVETYLGTQTQAPQVDADSENTEWAALSPSNFQSRIRRYAIESQMLAFHKSVRSRRAIATADKY